ncbi:imidazole glycerol phosphate synthase subunit HisH [Sulfuracidifex tepidarius]|uniref:Imidazole glycerol phosphate synthase subunit HisH n=1 Tax=Sulfuracidifex tepidarius TaxID=1294262 RepID=A0A510DV15_9CREN|nr:imidazole glycerol phosphate synthase subunit HisH [Sulfuracidifex tepidarius]BBG24019.1 Imidazole glycerol phosphate synthase subunit HisH [Sulfuracidifex tepidarius]BBG26774.1 Imidazole glycerol phosphate synthase subunit HisH [Sulfuracidifex tepidarius]
MKALVLNYGVGNLFSISSALKRNGFEVKIGDLERGYDLIVMPGVGSFSAVSSFLSSRLDVLRDLKGSNAFLGVCLGFQVLFDYGTEGGQSKGIGWFKGKVDLLHVNEKLPHVGWERLHVKGCNDLLQEMDQGYVYYVHSYVAYPERDPDAFSNYGGTSFPAVMCEGNVVGTQFHPEKSDKTGRIFFDNLSRWLKR